MHFSKSRSKYQAHDSHRTGKAVGGWLELWGPRRRKRRGVSPRYYHPLHTHSCSNPPLFYLRGQPDGPARLKPSHFRSSVFFSSEPLFTISFSSLTVSSLHPGNPQPFLGSLTLETCLSAAQLAFTGTRFKTKNPPIPKLQLRSWRLRQEVNCLKQTLVICATLA